MQVIIRNLFTGKTNISNDSLRMWNVVLTVLFAAQGAAILLFSAAYALPVTVSFLTKDSLQTSLAGHTVTASATHQLFMLNLAYVVAAFFFIAAVAHLLAATIYRSRYEAELKKASSPLRWIEYAIGSGVMLVVISLLAGVYDFATLVLAFSLTGIMALSGLVLELHNPFVRRGKAWFECLSGIIALKAGLLPWLLIALYMFCTNVFGSGHVPAYLCWIYGSILGLFILTGLNTYLVLTKKGKWANYLYGERWYMILSLLVKSALAWQVFAAVLRP